jgi:hypothetical protein
VKTVVNKTYVVNIHFTIDKNLFPRYLMHKNTRRTLLFEILYFARQAVALF